MLSQLTIARGFNTSRVTWLSEIAAAMADGGTAAPGWLLAGLGSAG